MAGGHLRKAEFARQCGDAFFVIAVAIGVHQHDRDGENAVGFGALKLAAHGIEIERAFHRAVGAHTFVNLDDALVQHVRLDDVLGKNLRPRLVADAQRVAKTFGDKEHRALTLALKQRVGGDRGAHLHGADALAGNRRARGEAEQVANAGHRGVAIGLGVFRQQLMGDERAVRPPADHVGKSAPAIDPEFPSSAQSAAQRVRHALDLALHLCHNGRERRAKATNQNFQPRLPTKTTS